MLEPALKNRKIELLAQNFRPDEIDEIGRLLFKKYNSHLLTGTETHFTLSPRKCAAALVDECIEKDRVEKLIELIVSLDDQTILGRQVRIEGLEEFLNNLAHTGTVYDFRKRRLVKARKELDLQPGWGSLNEGKRYSITVMSLDVAGNSALVSKYGNRVMEKIYFHLRRFLENRIYRYDGRIWNFAGDGGIVAFTFRGHQDRGVLCALEIQRSLPIFHLQMESPLKESIALRIGLDTGKLKFSNQTGNIVSEVINYASHLEKQNTSAGGVSISGNLHGEISSRIASVFECTGDFEGRSAYCMPNRLDLL
ncbi:adenylate/guanylate cyclase domain-containing protein [Marispirochaeta aestuarii]|uniref:adenylate/guanylate cyclase domain-containing protein n=1 Tax=Marispirochaeta aestuarii TaxID=1963862 RepID=UPI0029C6900C|nr:adenylate/guanylate cyclase domain-containing protein [Marispirochaeta aestuarii]